MAMVERRELERLRYWQGQMLRSRDFRDDGAIEAQRRWWHNRALHAAFGINYGLQVAGDASSRGYPHLVCEPALCGIPLFVWAVHRESGHQPLLPQPPYAEAGSRKVAALDDLIGVGRIAPKLV